MRRFVLLALLISLVLPVFAQDNPPLDPETLTATELAQLPLRSASPGTAAYLAPDGERLIHVDFTVFCLYTLDGTQEWCSDFKEANEFGNFVPDFESASWSPDGRHLAFNTEVWQRWRDSDIWVLDSETGEFLNITQDDYDGKVPFGDFDMPEGAYMETSPAWLPDGSMTFIRHSTTPRFIQPSLWLTTVGGEAEKLTDLQSSAESSNLVLRVSWSPDGSTMAFIMDKLDNPESGIWTYTRDTGEIALLYAISDRISPSMSVTFSPDGESLLLMNPSIRVQNITSQDIEENGTGYFVVDAATEDAVPLVADARIMSAGWLPDGGLIYTLMNIDEPEKSGLYVTAAPKTPGRKILDLPVGEDDQEPLPLLSTTSEQVAPLSITASGRTLLATRTPLTLAIELQAE